MLSQARFLTNAIWKHQNTNRLKRDDAAFFSEASEGDAEAD